MFVFSFCISAVLSDAKNLTAMVSSLSLSPPDNHDDSDDDCKVVEEQPLPKILSIWQDEHVELKVTKSEDGITTTRWLCNWCGCTFSGKNATKAVRHLSKLKGMDVKPCSGRIDPKCAERYKKMME